MEEYICRIGWGVFSLNCKIMRWEPMCLLERLLQNSWSSDPLTHMQISQRLPGCLPLSPDRMKHFQYELTWRHSLAHSFQTSWCKWHHSHLLLFYFILNWFDIWIQTWPTNMSEYIRHREEEKQILSFPLPLRSNLLFLFLICLFYLYFTSL